MSVGDPPPQMYPEIFRRKTRSDTLCGCCSIDHRNTSNARDFVIKQTLLRLIPVQVALANSVSVAVTRIPFGQDGRQIRRTIYRTTYRRALFRMLYVHASIVRNHRRGVENYRFAAL